MAIVHLFVPVVISYTPMWQAWSYRIVLFGDHVRHYLQYTYVAYVIQLGIIDLVFQAAWATYPSDEAIPIKLVV